MPEDVLNALHDLRQRIRELGFAGRLHLEAYGEHRLLAAHIAVRLRLDAYTALTVAVATVRGVPLVLEDDRLYDRPRPATLSQAGLCVVRLADVV